MNDTSVLVKTMSWAPHNAWEIYCIRHACSQVDFSTKDNSYHSPPSFASTSSPTTLHAANVKGRGNRALILPLLNILHANGNNDVAVQNMFSPS